LLGHYDDEEGIGEVVNVQWAATDFNVEFPNRGFIARSNHFVRPIRGAEDRIKFDEEAGMNTFIRLERANRILGRFANRGRLGRRALEAVFQDHYNRPNSICAHAVEKEDHLRQSNSSIIMDLVAPSLSYTEGPPCTTTYHTIQL
jgi:isopenicillin-N N-acyltransferase-like protein